MFGLRQACRRAVAVRTPSMFKSRASSASATSFLCLPVGEGAAPETSTRRCLLLLATASFAAASDLRSEKPLCDRRPAPRWPWARSVAVANEGSTKTVDLQFIVIGATGQGKSTVLNKFAGTKLFQVGAGLRPCTRAGGEWDTRNIKEFTIHDNLKKRDYRCRVLDTPGFPDPDRSKAADYYDHVVRLCRETPLNGVLFVVRPQREVATTMEMYEVLLKEFTKLGPPLVMLVNGDAEEQGDEDEHDFQARKEAEIEAYSDFARRLMPFVHVRNALISHRSTELASLATDVAKIFALEHGIKSPSMLTFAELQAELEKCKNDKYAAEFAVKQAEDKIKKCQQDINSLRAEAQTLESIGGVVGAGAFVSAVVTPVEPTAGALLASASSAILFAVAGSQKSRVVELYKEMADAENEIKAVGDLEKIRAKYDMDLQQFNKMAAALGKEGEKKEVSM